MSETVNESLVTLKYGLVEDVDAAKHRVKVLLPDMDEMITHWLPVRVDKTQDDKDYSLPDKGEQVALLLDARGEQGIVLGSVYSEADPPPVDSGDKWHKRFKDGTYLEYDRSAHVLKVEVKGEITIKADGPVKVEGQNITVKGLTVKIEAQALTVEAQAVTFDSLITTTNNLLVKGKLAFNPLA